MYPSSVTANGDVEYMTTKKKKGEKTMKPNTLVIEKNDNLEVKVIDGEGVAHDGGGMEGVGRAQGDGHVSEEASPAERSAGARK